ncbi:hypothetical protein [Mobiluncus holmesii]|uniref:hypothetical protein n=1 Tax=Mobiluncus holmesii TaxID=144178 RepID=UPI0021CBCA88|nr:hypothetical protein [Mobiluncus holmesii]
MDADLVIMALGNSSNPINPRFPARPSGADSGVPSRSVKMPLAVRLTALVQVRVMGLIGRQKPPRKPPI